MIGSRTNNREIVIVPAKTHYLEMTELLSNEIIISEQYTLTECKNISTDEYLSLYKNVGEKWGWTGRLLLKPEELKNILNSDLSSVYKFHLGDELLGFVEFSLSEFPEIEISYLGLLPEYAGKGIGKIFLQSVLQLVWSLNPNRVWLHTCEFDHPAALKAYQNAGFRIYKTKVEKEMYFSAFLKNT